MNTPSEQTTTTAEETVAPAKRCRWNRVLRWTIAVVLLVTICIAYLIKDQVRTLQSLRRVPGTNAYVMDYYGDYNIDQIRSHGMDVHNVEDGLIAVYFPDWLTSIGRALKGHFLDEEVETIRTDEERCSTVVLRPPSGPVLFGRNFDWKHDACLILRVHRGGSLASVSVLDLHYLNLDRDDLEETSLFQRIPLLFAPYYLQDGMNRHGVAVSDMSVDGTKAPYDAVKPNVIHATAMRLILDYASTTEEAIALLKQYNIHFAAATCHLMISDASGKSAVVEFIDGQMQTTRTDETWQVCTNHQVCGTTEERSDEECSRYRLASEQLAKLGSEAGSDDVLRIMESVSKENWTMWTSVYNLTSGSFSVAYRRHFDRAYHDQPFTKN